MKRILLFSLASLFSLLTYCQSQFNNWYIGNMTGISFNTTSPSLITTNPMLTTDNAASVSDATGNILFYCNGEEVYDRTNIIMPNGSGLNGNISGGQAATIVQMPGSSSIYYIFTSDGLANPLGIEYSVVDMSLHGGLGDVVTTQKNQILLAPATEKVVPIRHKNGVDAWILVHEWRTNAYRAYLLTSSGLSTNPVTTNIGSIHNGGYQTGYNAIGQLTVNKANNKVAAAIYSDGLIEMFDFNNATGGLSNAISFPLYRALGIEFSAGSNQLYATSWSDDKIYQFNISSNNVTMINSSKLLLGSSSGAGYLQMAPNGKIYVAKYQTNYLGVINSPDSMGMACNFVDTGFYTGSNQSSAGLVDKILVNGSFPAEVEQVDKQQTIVCYPSPAPGRFYMTLPSEWEGTKEIVVYDMLGKQVLSKTDIRNKVFIDSQLAPGAYFVSASNGSQKATTKVIIE